MQALFLPLFPLSPSQLKIVKIPKETCANPRCGGMKLPTFLLTPVQRIPRYMLLFKELLKETQEDHPDHGPCQETFKKFQELADFVNNSLKESEGRKKLGDLKKNINGLKNLESPNRTLIKEGPASLITPKKKYQCLLFNDLLVFATGSETKVNSLVLILQLDTVWYEDLEDLDPQTVREDAIEIYTPDRPYILYTGNISEKKLWLAALKKAISASLGGAEDIVHRKGVSFEYKDGSVYKGDWVDGRVRFFHFLTHFSSSLFTFSFHLLFSSSSHFDLFFPLNRGTAWENSLGPIRQFMRGSGWMMRGPGKVS